LTLWLSGTGVALWVLEAVVLYNQGEEKLGLRKVKNERSGGVVERGGDQ